MQRFKVLNVEGKMDCGGMVAKKLSTILHFGSYFNWLASCLCLYVLQKDRQQKKKNSLKIKQKLYNKFEIEIKSNAFQCDFSLFFFFFF